jgi:chitin disaccharide deacetylase
MHQAQLIVNGDDFGKSPEVNEAIIRSFRAGTLTSCSLMVTGDAFDHAVRLVRENSRLAVGIHLVTVQGKAVLPHAEIPNLVDREGHFPHSPVAAGLKFYFSRPAREQLAKELAAQFQKFDATGLKLSHVDSHLHMHVHPVIFAAAVELAESYGVRRMRVPQDDFRLAVRFGRLSPNDKNPPLPPFTKGGNPVCRPSPKGGSSACPPFVKGGWGDLIGGAITAIIFGLLTHRMKRQLLARCFSFAEQVYGHLYSGRMTLEYVLFVLEHLSERTNEIYFHPAIIQDGVAVTIEAQQSARELDILINSDFRRRLRDPSINLTNYFELAANE